MSVTQYIGARYVPIFADPEEWSADRAYEPLTIVTHEGNSYTSKQAVPIGIEITNKQFWALTSNYNAQIEAYRREVQQFDGRITDNAEAISEETTARANADSALQGEIDALQGEIDTVKESTIKNGIVFIGDSWAQGYSPDGNTNSWVNIITPILENSGHKVFSKFLGGCGFVAGTKPYLTLLQELSETIEDKENISKIIFQGSWNDKNKTQSELVTALNQLYSYCSSNYPNAALIIDYVACGNFAVSTAAQGARQCQTVYSYIANAIQNNGVKFDLVYGIDTLITEFASDGYHPNQDGQEIIAQHVLATINGTQFIRYVNMNDTNLETTASTVTNNVAIKGFSIPINTHGYNEFPLTYFSGVTNLENTKPINLNNLTALVSYSFENNLPLFRNPISTNAKEIYIPVVIQVQNNNDNRNGTFYNLNALAHIYRTNEGKAVLGLYSTKCANASGTNYLAGDFKQVQF